MSFSQDAWKTYSFDSAKIVEYLSELIKMLTDMGVDITNRRQLKEGFEKLFHIEYCNFPDLDERGYILAPNHVSDFDALILGLVHKDIKIMSKIAWVENAKLMEFLSIHYDLIGIDRDSKVNQARALVALIQYLRSPSQARHVLIFPQGTISDINRNSIERVQSGVFALSTKSDTPVLPVYVEQPNFRHPTRIVFGEPMDIPARKQDCRELWREKIISLQNSLIPIARPPILTEKHANNNKPADPFF